MTHGKKFLSLLLGLVIVLSLLPVTALAAEIDTQAEVETVQPEEGCAELTEEEPDLVVPAQPEVQEVADEPDAEEPMQFEEQEAPDESDTEADAPEEGEVLMPAAEGGSLQEFAAVADPVKLSVGASGTVVLKANEGAEFTFTPSKTDYYMLSLEYQTKDFFAVPETYAGSELISEEFWSGGDNDICISWRLTGGTTYRIVVNNFEASKVTAAYSFATAPSSGSEETGEWTIKNGVLSISGNCWSRNWSFRGSEITSVTYSNVSFVWGLSDLKNLTSVKLANNTELIEENALVNCPKLKKVTVPKSVTQIGKHALGYLCEWTTVENADGSAYDKENYSKVTGFTIYGYKGTAAQTYAKNNGLTFVALDDMPQTPKLTAIENVNGGVTVTWGKVSGAEKYQLWRKVSGGSWAKVGTPTTATSYTDKTTVSGTTYIYTVRAIAGDLQSDYDRTGLTIMYLSAPTVTKAANLHAGIQLVWKETPGCNGYNIYRKLGSGSYSLVTVVKGSSNTSYTDTSVQADGGRTYTYRIMAYRDSYKSTYQYSSAIVRLDTPSITKVENGNSGVTVTWGAVTGAEKYQVWRKTSGGSWAKVGTPTTATRYTDKTTVSGTTYIYTVQAISGSSQSSYSSTGRTIMYLSAPTVTKIANLHAGIQLTWKETPGCNGYNIYRKLGSGSYSLVTVVKGSDNTTFTDTSVQANGGSTYTYRIMAYRSTYKSAYQYSTSIIRLDTPAIKSLTQTSNGVVVKWNTITGCNGYNIYRKEGNGSYVKLGNVTGSSASSFTDTGVKGKKGTYTYKIEAYRSQSKSAFHTKTIILK